MKLPSLAAIAIIASTTFVGAHSDDMATMPADGDVLQTVPEAIMFTFDEAVRLTRIEMTHVGHPAMDLDLGEQQSFATEYSVPVIGMGGGTYQIEWRGLGIDGHPVQGGFSFEVE